MALRTGFSARVGSWPRQRVRIVNWARAMTGSVLENMLGDATSPYLLQHKDNPVHWRPWGDVAFREASERNVPVFLSVGYSTCHWCHVMARESFEDAEIARALNESFVAVKVDREERPDVDAEYMLFVQATNNGAGGWPLSVFITPERVPFFGATYIAPPRFAALLAAISAEWKTRRPQIEASGDRIVSLLQDVLAHDSTRIQDKNTTLDAFQGAAADALGGIDRRLGGFGDGGPKFPNAPLLALLLSALQSVDVPMPLPNDGRAAVCTTLRAMARGALWDHVGCGFHRYTVDSAWSVPHFEKMLYDQALLLAVYARAMDAFAVQISDNTLAGPIADGSQDNDCIFKMVVLGVSEYMLGVLRSPDGAFYCAEDADSAPLALQRTDGAASVDSKDTQTTHENKREGAFYVWRHSELLNVLSNRHDTFSKAYSVLPNGNVSASHDPHGELRNVNILKLAHDSPFVLPALKSVSGHEITFPEQSHMLDFLRESRDVNRPRPHMDRKVLAAWNGIAVSGLCAAFYATGILSLLEAAMRAISCIESAFCKETARGGLHIASRCMLDERLSDAPAVADDYASLIAACLDLWNATLNREHLERALALQKTLDARYWNSAAGAYAISPLSTGESAKDCTGREEGQGILNLTPLKDSAEPCCNGIALQNLLRLCIAAPHAADALAEKISKLSAKAIPDVSMATLLTAAFDFGDEGRVAKISLPVKMAGDALGIRRAVRSALADRVGTPRVLVPANDGAPAQLCIDRTCRPINL